MSALALTTLRVQAGHERDAMRVFAPLKASHPAVADGGECAVCGLRFRAGQRATVIPLGPGNDPEQREKARRGGWYTAPAAVAHAACAGLDEEEDST